MGLKAFKKVSLEAGESKEVELIVSKQELSYYDEQEGWKSMAGSKRRVCHPRSFLVSKVMRLTRLPERMEELVGGTAW